MSVNEFLSSYYLMKALDGQTIDEITKEFFNEVGQFAIDQNLYFDMFNPTPFWNKVKPIVEGMRTNRPHIYENFELLNNKRLSWTKKRRKEKDGLLLPLH